MAPKQTNWTCGICGTEQSGQKNKFHNGGACDACFDSEFESYSIHLTVDRDSPNFAIETVGTANERTLKKCTYREVDEVLTNYLSQVTDGTNWLLSELRSRDVRMTPESRAPLEKALADDVKKFAKEQASKKKTSKKPVRPAQNGNGHTPKPFLTDRSRRIVWSQVSHRKKQYLSQHLPKMPSTSDFYELRQQYFPEIPYHTWQLMMVDAVSTYKKLRFDMLVANTSTPTKRYGIPIPIKTESYTVLVKPDANGKDQFVIRITLSANTLRNKKPYLVLYIPLTNYTKDFGPALSTLKRISGGQDWTRLSDLKICRTRASSHKADDVTRENGKNKYWRFSIRISITERLRSVEEKQSERPKLTMVVEPTRDALLVYVLNGKELRLCHDEDVILKYILRYKKTQARLRNDVRTTPRRKRRLRAVLERISENHARYTQTLLHQLSAEILDIAKRSNASPIILNADQNAPLHRRLEGYSFPWTALAEKLKYKARKARIEFHHENYIPTPEGGDICQIYSDKLKEDMRRKLATSRKRIVKSRSLEKRAKTARRQTKAKIISQ